MQVLTVRNNVPPREPEGHRDRSRLADLCRRPGGDPPQAVLVVEDGPTLTHGEMAYGAGWVAAQRFGAAEIIDPRPFAMGTISATYDKYPTTGNVLPAMGYGDKQMRELERTINRSDADLVLIGTPIDLGRLIKIEQAHPARAL